jgi:glycosyltransferase involved in cell wall biosynthesis
MRYNESSIPNIEDGDISLPMASGLQNNVPFATTVNYKDDARWFSRAQIIESPYTLSEEIRAFFQLLLQATKVPAIVFDSSSGKIHAELLVAGLLGLLPKSMRPATILMGCMWKKDKGLAGLIQSLIVRFADKGLDLYAVQSSEELSDFPQTWGINKAKMRFCPYFYTVTAEDVSEGAIPEKPYIFAGGNSHRDYEPLIEAARQMPDYPFIVATRLLDDRTDLPSNMIVGTVPHKKFMSLMQNAMAVVVPMRRGLSRAAGQQTYLNAMWFAKPTIITNVFAVRDHITHQKDGLVIDGSSEELHHWLQWLTDKNNAEAVTQLSQEAEKTAKCFSFENHVSYLLAILNEAIEKHQAKTRKYLALQAE